MKAGAAIYADQCSACHAKDGRGVDFLFPALAGSPNVHSEDPTSLVRVVLQGARSLATAKEPTGPGMPSFAWKLSDAEIAAVLTMSATAGRRRSRGSRRNKSRMRASPSWKRKPINLLSGFPVIGEQ